MTGPAVVTQSKDRPAFQEEWRATFADHAFSITIEGSDLSPIPSRA
jgi:hypothetical protein